MVKRHRKPRTCKIKYRVVSPRGRVVALACNWKQAANVADKFEVGHYVYRIEKVNW